MASEAIAVRSRARWARAYRQGPGGGALADGVMTVEVAVT
jgi:hypothetical protein